VIRASLAAAGLAAFLLVAPLVAADAPNRLTATIAPAAVQPPGLGPYTIAITNQPNSAEATSGSIAIPAGFIVDGVVSPPTVSVSSPCSDRTWTASVGASAINLAPATPADALCDRGTLTVTFNVITAPPTDGQWPWTTSLAPDFDPQSPTLTIDGTPPDTAIAGTPPSLTDATASFGFTGSDGGVGVASFECSLDGAAFSGCANPASYGGLANGDHTFAVRSIVSATSTRHPTSGHGRSTRRRHRHRSSRQLRRIRATTRARPSSTPMATRQLISGANLTEAPSRAARRVSRPPRCSTGNTPSA
jgi:hypothetical protein